MPLFLVPVSLDGAELWPKALVGNFRVPSMVLVYPNARDDFEFFELTS